MKRFLIALGVLVAVLAAVFCAGRFGWRLSGFSACEGALIESVDVDGEKVTISGGYGSPDGKRFLGCYYTQDGGALYVGFHFSGVFGAFCKPDFTVEIPAQGVEKVYMRSRESECVIWTERENSAPSAPEGTGGAQTAESDGELQEPQTSYEYAFSCAFAPEDAAPEYSDSEYWASAFTFTALADVTDVRLVALDYDMDSDTLSLGETLLEKGALSAGDSFCASLATGEVIPNRALCFTAGGAEYTLSVSISGRDGSAMLAAVTLGKIYEYPMSCAFAPEDAAPEYSDSEYWASAFTFTALADVTDVRLVALDYDMDSDTLSLGETLLEKGALSAGDSFCASLATGEVIPNRALCFTAGGAEYTLSVSISGRDGSAMLAAVTLGKIYEYPMSCAFAPEDAAPEYSDSEYWASAFTFTALADVTDVRLVALDYDMDSDTLSLGETLLEKGALSAGDSFCASLATGEVIPNRALCFTAGGAEYTLSVSISGRDGSAMLSPIS